MTKFAKNTVCVCAIGYKGLRFLELATGRMKIARVISYKPSGKESETYEQIMALCGREGIEFSKNARPALSAIEADLVFFIGWQYLVSDMDERCVVFHDSLLPRYRGFAPTVTALINGDPEIGVTALLPDANADEGPIISQARVTVSHPMRLKDAFDALAECYARLGQEIASGSVPPKATPQPNDGATYSIWRDAADYFIDWAQPSDAIQRLIFACSWPYNGARTYYKGRVVVIEDADSLPDPIFIEQRKFMVRKFVQNQNEMPLIICGHGLLRIKSAVYEDGETVDFSTALQQRIGWDFHDQTKGDRTRL